MTDQLWAPWRMEYMGEIDSPDCVFCAAANTSDADKRTFRILTTRANEFVIINKYPYTFGHLLVCPKKHVANLEDLSPSEQQSLFKLTVDAQTTVKKVLHPHGLNLGINLGKQAGAGIEKHLHTHIVPRWVGDTNFMPVIADCHIMPGHLDTLYEQLLVEFSKI